MTRGGVVCVKPERDSNVVLDVRDGIIPGGNAYVIVHEQKHRWIYVNPSNILSKIGSESESYARNLAVGVLY